MGEIDRQIADMVSELTSLRESNAKLTADVEELKRNWQQQSDGLKDELVRAKARAELAENNQSVLMADMVKTDKEAFALRQRCETAEGLLRRARPYVLTAPLNMDIDAHFASLDKEEK